MLSIEIYVNILRIRCENFAFYTKKFPKSVFFILYFVQLTNKFTINWQNFTFCWPCLSVQFVLITNLTHFFNVFVSLLYMFRATRPSTQSDIYQMMYWNNWLSWWWALGWSKHVEKWNKHIKNCVKLVINTKWIDSLLYCSLLHCSYMFRHYNVIFRELVVSTC